MQTHGIDVSRFQGFIDWSKVKDRIDFAILRCGYGRNNPAQDDPTFKRNADECTRLKIPFGVYLYSYARNNQDALSEAQHVLRLVKNYQMSYPIYYDLEDEATTGKESNETIASLTKVFMDELEKNDYYGGVYASLYWWKTKLTDPIFNRYTKWIANYANELNYQGDYDMWQYSASGWIDGIDARVDLDYAYKDFPTIIKEAGLNNYNRAVSLYKVGDRVRFQYVYLTSESQNPLKPYRNVGTITKIVGGARNPYLIGNDQGWVNNQVIEGQVTYLSNPDYIGDSFPDALKQIGIDSSFQNRKYLASLNGIEDYQGTGRQNLTLLQLLKEGLLIS